MGKFRKGEKKEVPGINTGSMSDIIFMFLFFFMVITTMRESTLFVKFSSPQATEVQKLEKKNLVSYIYVGLPIDVTTWGSEPRVQLDDAIADVKEIPAFIEKERAVRDEVDRKFLVTSIKSDKATKMGLISDIKEELKYAGALKLSYSASKKGKK